MSKRKTRVTKLSTILLVGALSSVALIEIASAPPWLAVVLGASSAYGYKSVIDAKQISKKAV